MNELAHETRAAELLREILAARDRALAELDPAGPAPLFCVFWDFDGTILKGDMSEGLRADGRTVFPGLLQLGIEAGYAPDFRGPGAFERFWSEYERLEREEGRYVAYTFLPKLFRGAPVDALRSLARERFDREYRFYFFQHAVALVRALQRENVHQSLISASPDFFVTAAGESLSFDPRFVSGIEVAVVDGLVTDTIVEPVNFAEGKTRRVKLYIERLSEINPGRDVVPLAGFGDSYPTDGDFLAYLAGTRVPGGRALAYINQSAPAPASYAGLFRRVNFESITRDGNLE